MTHSSILAWGVPMDRRAWRAAVHRVAQSRARLKRLRTNARISLIQQAEKLGHSRRTEVCLGIPVSLLESSRPFIHILHLSCAIGLMNSCQLHADLFLREGVSPMPAFSRALGSSLMSLEAESQEPQCQVPVPARQ